MEKNIVIRANASLALLAGAFGLLLALLMAAALVAYPMPEIGTFPPVLTRVAGMAAVLLFGGIAVGGIASGAGVLKRRPWAHVSVMIFAALVAFFGGTGFLIMLFIPNLVDATADHGSAGFLRAALVGFYAASAAVGAWWLILFSGRDAQTYFADRPAPSRRGVRPLSVTLIAAWFMAGAGAASAAAVLRLPAPVFGVWAEGWRAFVLYTALVALQVELAAGLLQLSERERVRGIFYLALLGTDALVCAVAAGYVREMRGLSLETGAVVRFSSAALPLVWILAGACLLGVVLPIWLLIRSRAAFRSV